MPISCVSPELPSHVTVPGGPSLTLTQGYVTGSLALCADSNSSTAPRNKVGARKSVSNV